MCTFKECNGLYPLRTTLRPSEAKETTVSGSDDEITFFAPLSTVAGREGSRGETDRF
jgi:hypothetical protein